MGEPVVMSCRSDWPSGNLATWRPPALTPTATRAKDITCETKTAISTENYEDQSKDGEIQEAQREVEERHDGDLSSSLPDLKRPDVKPNHRRSYSSCSMTESTAKRVFKVDQFNDNDQDRSPIKDSQYSPRDFADCGTSVRSEDEVSEPSNASISRSSILSSAFEGSRMKRTSDDAASTTDSTHSEETKRVPAEVSELEQLVRKQSAKGCKGLPSSFPGEVLQGSSQYGARFVEWGESAHSVVDRDYLRSRGLQHNMAWIELTFRIQDAAKTMRSPFAIISNAPADFLLGTEHAEYIKHIRETKPPKRPVTITNLPPSPPEIPSKIRPSHPSIPPGTCNGCSNLNNCKPEGKDLHSGSPQNDLDGRSLSLATFAWYFGGAAIVSILLLRSLLLVCIALESILATLLLVINIVLLQVLLVAFPLIRYI